MKKCSIVKSSTCAQDWPIGKTILNIPYQKAKMNETPTSKGSIHTKSLWQHHQLWVYGYHLAGQKQNIIYPKIRTHFSAAYCYTTISGSSGPNHCFFKMWYKAATDKLLHIFLPKPGHSRDGLSSGVYSLEISTQVKPVVLAP